MKPQQPWTFYRSFDIGQWRFQIYWMRANGRWGIYRFHFGWDFRVWRFVFHAISLKKLRELDYIE